MQGSSDGQFVARYWLNSMPDIKIKAFQRNKGSSTLPGEGESQNSTKRSANSFLLASGVDFEFKGHDGKNDDMQSADFCSDNSQDSGDEVHIGTEQHNFKSPAPRPMGSPLSRDITVDLMRFRSSAVVPFKKSSYGARQGTQFFGSEANLQAIEVTDRRSLQREPVQSPRIILNDGLTPRPVCDNTLAGRVPTAIGDKHEKRFETRQLASALHSWREAHAVTMLQKQRIVDQYFGCCAFMKRSPFLKTQLRRLLIKPSEEHLDLSGCGVTGRDITALMSALSGRGCDMKPDRVKSIQEVCNSLGDSCLTSIDLCSNNLGAGGALALNNALIMSEFFRLEQTLPGTNMCELVASLTELDMSNNALGIAGSAPIETLLSSPRCTLTKLNLSSNMLADPGCAVVARAMCKNSSLKHLNLSENAAANSTGQAIGVLLETNSSLELLNIAYNHLRGNGAKRIGFGLSQNKSLRNLDLKWNGFGDEDVLSELSRAIPVCGVQELNLAYNRIKLKGASIIAASLEMGTMIRELILDGNLIGQIGARVIYRAAQEGHARQEFRTSVSTVNCGTHIVDRAAFDPCETAGAYDLNLQDTYDKSVLFKLMRVAMSDNGSFVSIKINSRVTQYNATLGNDNVKICDNDSIDMLDWTICTSSGINLPLMEETDESGTVPLSRSWAKLLGRREENVTCLLRFAFNNNRKRATLSDCLTQGNYELLQSAFSDPTCSGDKCVESIETIFGSDTFISMEQMDSLCKILCEQQDAARHAELSRTRVIFVARCFHKLVPPPDSSVVLDKMTSMEERKALEKALGTASFDFTPNNPTGYHRLDLSDTAQREICMRLVELKNETEGREVQLREFYSLGRRAGGRRADVEDNADLERVWRNGKLDGAPFKFRTDWKVPHSGILELDFVQIIKPNPADVPRPKTGVSKDQVFLQMLQSLQTPEMTDVQRIGTVRRYSNSELFTCQQLASILALIREPEQRVEVCVIGYARTSDWHGFKNVTFSLGPRELKQLHSRLGFINLFDDIVAVDFYELDLERSAERFVMQELLHLASVEPGDNIIDCTYHGMDYTVPAGWLKEVPKSGVISFYYCREQQVIEKIFKSGSWDSGGSPYHTRVDGTEYGPSTWSTFIPRWLRQYCEASPKEGPVPCSQPFGGGWARPYKIRRIKMKMMDKFTDPVKMFQAMDRDGGGSLDRKELAMGLFNLGVWLAPTELQSLLETLDKDGGGDVDVAEFKAFWDAYSFD